MEDNFVIKNMDSADLSIAKIKWQCRRGMLELDIVLKSFLEKHFNQLSEAEKHAFVCLLRLSDPKLYYMIFHEMDSSAIVNEIHEINNVLVEINNTLVHDDLGSIKSFEQKINDGSQLFERSVNDGTQLSERSMHDEKQLFVQSMYTVLMMLRTT